MTFRTMRPPEPCEKCGARRVVVPDRLQPVCQPCAETSRLLARVAALERVAEAARHFTADAYGVNGTRLLETFAALDSARANSSQDKPD